jgi:aldehyde dehydrogenase (NAD+)
MLELLQEQRDYFESGKTLSYDFRKQQLLALKSAMMSYEQDLYDALYQDLKKNKEECWVTEIGFVVTEINAAVKRLKKWMSPKRVATNLLNLPSSSRIESEPLGVTLIISPWNYPLQLLFVPLVGAIAAGNCVTLKPSEFAPATNSVLKKIITQTFEEKYILFIEGDGVVVIPQMIEAFTFDHVFYTGGTSVGKSIYQIAAKNLIPVTLELGGKSPCVVESDANIDVAAKRIAMTKFSNCGQMCVAPDYVLVHSSVKVKLIEHLIKSIHDFYGDDIANSYEYGKMINEKQFDRVVGYLKNGKIVYGGAYDKTKFFITPTILTDVDLNSAVMNEEIFGPILPIISFDSFEEAKAIILRHKNPLAFYIFSLSKERQWLNAIPSGGACINNASLHLTNHRLPFGGRGFSGTGQYHGKFSFDTFSHKKAVLKTPVWFNPSIKYPPFKGRLNFFKKVIK